MPLTLRRSSEEAKKADPLMMQVQVQPQGWRHFDQPLEQSVAQLLQLALAVP